MTIMQPVVGHWYKDLEQKHLFEVVAMDEDSIEIQYFDGNVEELDHSTWEELALEGTQPPEDWSGPYDEYNAEDLGYSDIPMHPEDWTGPLNYLEGIELEGYDEVR